MPDIEAFWQRFLRETCRDPATQYYDCFYFDLTEKNANELLALVLEGKKKATASSLYAFEAEGRELPGPGTLSIVTDFAGNPRCVMETTAVTVLAFKDMTFALCSLEGEDDCLFSWQRSHTRFFTEEGKQLGYLFTEEMPVVFEEFAVVYQI